MKRLLRHPKVLAALAWVLARYLRLALASIRWRVVGEENLADAFAGRAMLVAVWHDELTMLPRLSVIVRRRGMVMTPRLLVSRHRDGQILAAVMRHFDTVSVHGSSRDRKKRERGGAAAVRQLVEILAGGEHVVVTPDGPRGPRHLAAPGLAQIAALSGAPILPIGCAVSLRWLMPTWDRMVFPLPFGRGVIAIGAPLPIPREGWREALPAAQAGLEAASGQASAMIGAA
jgi:lysophospholipid acyltransferase (LPLAT)-like uncharacterized protein